MIAYNKLWLYDLMCREQARHAYDNDFITKEEMDAVTSRHPHTFYSPNEFIRVGLFILTQVIQLFSFGLICLIFLNGTEHFFSGLLIFFSILSIVVLEYMIRVKKHFCSGVDDGLLWGASIALFCGLTFEADFAPITICMVGFFISILAFLRYSDRVMAVLAFLSFLGILFNLCIEIGTSAKAIVPFVVMAASAITYFIMRRLQQNNNIVYGQGVQLVLSISLLSFYLGADYYVVRELSNNMFHLNLQPGEGIPFGWLFWIFTFTIPVFYLLAGIIKKDAILLRAGLFLIAAIVFTVRYYYEILSIEMLATVAGSFLLLIAYAIMKYLHEPKFGFTYYQPGKPGDKNVQVESLLLAQTFTPTPPAGEGTSFGGGTFGGGGASGEF